MPGPFEIAFFFDSYDGGRDCWLGGVYNPRGQWFSIWHCSTAEWWSAQSGWRCDGWSFYPAVPFPQLMRDEWNHASSTDTHDWGRFLAAGGPANWDNLATWWAAKGKGKGRGKGKAKAKAKGKGKSKGKGQGKVKGTD